MVHSKYIVFASAMPREYGVYKNMRIGDKVYQKKFGVFCLKEDMHQITTELPEGAYMQNMETAKAFDGTEVVEGFYADYSSDATFVTLNLTNNAEVSTGFSAEYTDINRQKIKIDLSAGANIIPCFNFIAGVGLSISLGVPDVTGFVSAGSWSINVDFEVPLMEKTVMYYAESNIYIQHINSNLYTLDE